jgi:hypothetical protein
VDNFNLKNAILNGPDSVHSCLYQEKEKTTSTTTKNPKLHESSFLDFFVLFFIDI